MSKRKKKPRQRMTPKRIALLETIKQEQTWADAHYLNRLHATTVEDEKFHAGHQEIAVKRRNELLAQAPEIVKVQFNAFIDARHQAQEELARRLNAVDAKLKDVTAQIDEVRTARKINWRNYRSRPSHAFMACWEQDQVRLQAEKTYLETLLAHEAIVMLLK